MLNMLLQKITFRLAMFFMMMAGGENAKDPTIRMVYQNYKKEKRNAKRKESSDEIEQTSTESAVER